ASALMAAPVAAQTPARSPTAAADSTAHTRWLISGSAGLAVATEQAYTAPIIGRRPLWWLDVPHALVLDGRFSRGGRDDVSPGCITGECAAAFGKARRLTTWFAGIESHIARAGTHQPVTFRLTAGVGQAVMLTPARTSGARRADSELAVNVGAVFETPVRGRLVARFERDATLSS